MSYQNKYLKYKNKYLDLKKQIGGSLINNNKPVNEPIPECPICMLPFNNTNKRPVGLHNIINIDNVNTSLEHFYCLECYNNPELSKKQCATCRQPIVPGNRIYDYNETTHLISSGVPAAPVAPVVQVGPVAPVAQVARPPITNTTNCLALLQNGVYSKTELLSMMRKPSRDLKCTDCDERGCYGRCEARDRCNCVARCEAPSCNAHAQFRIMSMNNLAHPHYYSVEYYCPVCERVGCKCNVPSNVRYFNDNNYDGSNNGGGGSSDNGYSRYSRYSGRDGSRNREDEW
jgi:hypothetical protein